jgi:hypothetical protein
MLKQTEIDYLRELSDFILENERVSIREFKDFEELNDFENFEHFKKCLDENKFRLVVNYTNLHNDLFFTERIKTINKIIYKSIPLIVAIIISIFGIFNGNFSYLLLLPTYYLSQILSANNMFFKRHFLMFILTLISFYLFWDLKFLGGAILLSFIFNIIMFGNYRKNRSNFIFNAAQADEKIFVFYFYFRLFTIFSNTSEKIIFCRKDYNVS